MFYDYHKLRQRMHEKDIDEAELASRIGISSTLMSLKLNNKACFVQSEILGCMTVLDIDGEDVGEYFFTKK